MPMTGPKTSWSRKIIRFLASIKLAVVIILGLGVITAWGTFVEAEYNAEIAQKTVYHSWLMYGVLAALCLCLTAVMVDRWPWKKRHAPFVLAHIGILVLMGGSAITRYFGIDGSMIFEIGESNRHIILPGPELIVYSSVDAQSYTRLSYMDRDFYLDPPPKEGIDISLPDAKLQILDYVPFAIREQKIVASTNSGDAPAVRFQLQNANVNMTEWIIGTGKMRDAVKDLGPAKIVLTNGHYRSDGSENAIVLTPSGDGQSMKYEIYSRRDPASVIAPGTKAAARTGTVKPGDVIETPWMGMVMRILNYLPLAKEEVIFHPKARPTQMTRAALKVKFNEHEQWVALDSMVKFYTDTAVYIVSYANRRIDIAKAIDDPSFNMTLKKFEVGRYQGTMRAASYESLVTVPALGDVLISMNEPLKYGGFTFYQASFQEDETGRATHSILSVNYDPGRYWKHLGSLLICVGSTLLFYNKRRPKKLSAGGVA